MNDYALLLLPSANRVYAEAAIDLTVAELDVFNAAVLDGRLADIAPSTIGGVPYVTFAAPSLTGQDVNYLSNASAAYALFERQGELLRPVELTPLDQFDDDLVTIQKYPGKTNEQFTKLLLNVTLLSSDSASGMLDRRLRVLDPLCGRGTALNQALTYGYDAAGLDLDSKDFEAYSGFLKTYLKRKRIKHQVLEDGPVRRERKVVARRLRITLGATKESYRAGETLSLDVVNADTMAAGDFFRAETFDAIVADAPYGIHHGSTGPKGLRRGPMELLTGATPGWVRLMRPGAALGMSWNTFVARREDAAAVLTDAGLEVLDEGPYLRFAHRVDQGINRDILIARKPA
jgi:hypothetical protein